MSQFVKTITKTEVVTKRDVTGPDFINMSVEPAHNGINLVIGAKHEHKFASGLSKKGLARLIDILTEIHEALPDIK